MPLATLGRRILGGRSESLKDGLGSDHPALHGIVRALDLGDVHEPRAAADQTAPGERQPRQRLQHTADRYGLI